MLLREWDRDPLIPAGLVVVRRFPGDLQEKQQIPGCLCNQAKVAPTSFNQTPDPSDV
jgi:hypothetical protein